MFDALVKRFNPVLICHDCSATDIQADVILFFDNTSSHHIKIDGIESHSALKVEYMSDPHQTEVKGVYRSTNTPVHKLGREQRCRRALDRGVTAVISPVKEGFYKYLASLLPDVDLWYFPPAPWFKSPDLPIVNRLPEVLGNGATQDGGLGCYDFRKWAYSQQEVRFVPHAINSKTTKGYSYNYLLQKYAGALALSEFYPVPKYFEIPRAGCICFAQHHAEYEELGFKDMESCVYVTPSNFITRLRDFRSDIKNYQYIADNGMKLMENYTADKFAEFIDGKTQNIICGL